MQITELMFYVILYILVKDSQQKFQVTHEWTFINFTWQSPVAYQNAIKEGTYIPKNVAIAGIKIYKDNIYITIPKVRKGVPVTFGVIPLDAPKRNSLLSPFPSWEMNSGTSCNALQSVQSVEIDRNGTIWILDGVKINNNMKNPECPPKLVLIDLGTKKVEHSYNFPDEICLTKEGFLNDIVIDDKDEVFAYITDTSSIDPGIIVYSIKDNKSWKFRDRTMFADISALNYIVGGLVVTQLYPIDGIALSQISAEERLLFFSPLVGNNLYAISTKVLKDETTLINPNWRQKITLIGEKQCSSDGLTVDNLGNLYYTLLPLCGVGKWNTRESFNKDEVIEKNNPEMVWPDSFAFDGKGYLYLLSDNINQFMTSDVKLEIEIEPKFRIFKHYTNTTSYLYALL